MQTSGIFMNVCIKSVAHLVCTFSLWIYCTQCRLDLWSYPMIQWRNLLQSQCKHTNTAYQTEKPPIIDTWAQTAIHADIISIIITCFLHGSYMCLFACVQPCLRFVFTSMCVFGPFIKTGAEVNMTFGTRGTAGELQWAHSGHYPLLHPWTSCIPQKHLVPHPLLTLSRCPSVGPCSRAGWPQGSRVPAV